MSFTEILIVAVIAVLFLGPDKLPTALVQVAKFFKSFKSSINEAKSTFEQEVKLQELREDSLKYKKQLEKGAAEVRKKLTFEELEELKETKANVHFLKQIMQGFSACSCPAGDFCNQDTGHHSVFVAYKLTDIESVTFLSTANEDLFSFVFTDYFCNILEPCQHVIA